MLSFGAYSVSARAWSTASAPRPSACKSSTKAWCASTAPGSRARTRRHAEAAASIWPSSLSRTARCLCGFSFSGRRRATACKWNTASARKPSWSIRRAAASCAPWSAGETSAALRQAAKASWACPMASYARPSRFKRPGSSPASGASAWRCGIISAERPRPSRNCSGSRRRARSVGADLMARRQASIAPPTSPSSPSSRASRAQLLAFSGDSSASARTWATVSARRSSVSSRCTIRSCPAASPGSIASARPSASTASSGRLDCVSSFASRLHGSDWRGPAASARARAWTSASGFRSQFQSRPNRRSRTSSSSPPCDSTSPHASMQPSRSPARSNTSARRRQAAGSAGLRSASARRWRKLSTSRSVESRTLAARSCACRFKSAWGPAWWAACLNRSTAAWTSPDLSFRCPAESSNCARSRECHLAAIMLRIALIVVLTDGGPAVQFARCAMAERERNGRRPACFRA